MQYQHGKAIAFGAQRQQQGSRTKTGCWPVGVGQGMHMAHKLHMDLGLRQRSVESFVKHCHCSRALFTLHPCLHSTRARVKLAQELGNDKLPVGSCRSPLVASNFLAVGLQAQAWETTNFITSKAGKRSDTSTEA